MLELEGVALEAALLSGEVVLLELWLLTSLVELAEFGDVLLDELLVCGAAAELLSGEAVLLVPVVVLD